VPVDGVMENISFTTEYQGLSEAEVIIENVPEILEIKRDVYKRVNEICSEKCIFLVNTSCISITKVASFVKSPERVIGVHFMNPVPLKTTVEAIKGYHTSEMTIDATKAFLLSMGKEAILVNDYPGFVSNRLSHLLMNEAAYVVQDQVAEPKDVDDIFKKCFGHKMGPLETADLIGLDTVVNSLEVLYQSYQDPKFKCCPLLRKMVDAGLYGKKTGQGFYSYDEYEF
jgi:3-hydroxybutyryl-CoA dehydrogenase